MMNRQTILASMLLVLVAAQTSTATTVTFDNAGPANNADIPFDYGSFIAGNQTGFVTTDGTGATPNTALSWIGNLPGEWEYHTASVWSNYKTPVHVAQIDHNREFEFDDVTEIVFSPINGRAVSINSFVLIGGSGQGGEAIYDWEVVGTGTSGSLTIPIDTNTGAVPVNFTGTAGTEYTLRFTHDPIGTDNNIGTALDDLSFSEILLPGAEVLRLTVDRLTGSITLKNTGTNPANIKGYSITSEVGALETSGWKSISGSYDGSGSGNGSVDSDDTWTRLSTPGSGTDLSEFEFGGNGGTIAPSASVVLNNPGGGAWGKSPIEDVKLEVALVDGRVNKFSVDFVNGPAGGYNFGDLNFDGTIDALDWPVYHSGRGVDLSTLSLAQAYRQGDLDGDYDNDIADFVIFKDFFEVANGAGSFAAMLTVPEPASMAIWMTALAFVMGRRRTRRGVPFVCLAGALATGLLIAGTSQATTLTFADAPGSNADLPGTYGSNVATNSAAFVTTDGTGATPNIALTWAPVDAPNNNVLEFHSGPAFQNFAIPGFDVPILQFDLDLSGHSEPPPDPTIDFTVSDGFALNLGSFDIGNADDQSEPAYDWDINLIRLSDMQIVDTQSTGLLGPGDSEKVTFNFTGDADEDYRLHFDDGGANTVRTAIDNLGFSQVLTDPPKLKLVVSTATGAVSLTNDSGTNFDIDSYEIRSQSQSLDLMGWSSLQDQDFESNGDPGNGNGWEEAGGSGPNQLIESFLLGESTMADGMTPISLGAAYNNDKPGVQQDLEFFYHEAGTGGILRQGSVEYDQTGLACDLDGNGQCDAVDIEILVDNVVSGAAVAADIVTWLSDASSPSNPYLAGAKTFVIGDANLDGSVNSDDLGLLLNNFNSATNLDWNNGNMNGDGVIDSGDLGQLLNNFNFSSAAANTVAVPEPDGLAIAGFALAIGILGLRRRMPGNSVLASRLAMFMLVVLGACALANQAAFADVQLDRSYLFGDSPNESATAGAIVGNALGETLDSQSVDGTQFAIDAQNLTPGAGAAGPKYANVGSTGLNRPGASNGQFGARFDGIDDVLSGARLNRPDESVGPSFIGLGPVVFGFPDNYDEITARGLQMWVYPDAAALGGGRQGIVHDTIAAGGVSITADGKWTQTNDSKLNDGQIPATVPVVGDQWHHVMQHIYRTGDPGLPNILPGGARGDTGFTSVVYVNGVAVSANNGKITPGEADNSPGPEPRLAVLAVGAEELPTVDFVNPEFTNFFQGVVDDLELYVYGDNSSVTTSPPGQDYGTFQLLRDNNWISDRIAMIPNGGILREGDINFDGNVDGGDENAFVAGWLTENRLSGSLNDMIVGDWQTLGAGDLNLDGQVNLIDAIALDAALTAAGAGGLNFDRLTSVPEPTTFLLVAMCIGVPFARRRRRSTCH